MKRSDLFMFSVTCFIFANCASYVVRSGEPYLTGWGIVPPFACDIKEGIGFPFEFFSIDFGFIKWSWINGLANAGIAFLASIGLAACLAKRLPPLWPDQSRSLRFSLRTLLGFVTIACILFGFAISSRSSGLAMRNIICLGGPLALFGWFLYKRQIGWARLGVLAVGFTFFALALDFNYQDPPIDGKLIINALLPLSMIGYSQECSHNIEHVRAVSIIALTTIRATVYVIGTLSPLTIGIAMYSVVRQLRVRSGGWH